MSFVIRSFVTFVVPPDFLPFVGKSSGGRRERRLILVQYVVIIDGYVAYHAYVAPTLHEYVQQHSNERITDQSPAHTGPRTAL